MIATSVANDHKPATTRKAKDKKAPAWQKVKSVGGLYLQTATGGYFTRYRMKGKRTFRSLETDVLTIAKLRHKERMVGVERDRQEGGTISQDFQKLGELAKEVMKRVNASDRMPGSKRATEDHITRLRENWRRGSFDNFLVRHVTHDVLFELREHLRNKAPVRTSRRWNTGKMREKLGFAESVVNMTVWCLRQMLEIAVEKRVINSNPFATTGTLRESLLLKARSKAKELPAREDVEAMFADMRRVPDAADVENLSGEAAWHEGHKIGNLAYRESRAKWTADHAHFLALTGARLEEANASLIEDDLGDLLLVRGTKSKTSWRHIPVHPQLRQLLNRLKAESTDGRFLKVRHSLGPMARACKRLGIAKLSHHHMRHYYATICIESGVDIPTVSRWLGHGDGGALCMRTYGHLRDEHSKSMGQKVDFRPKPKGDLVNFTPAAESGGRSAQAKRG